MARTIRTPLAFLIGGAFLAAVAGTSAQAQEAAGAAALSEQEELDRTPVDCVVLNRVSNHVAVNDRQVVFFMRGNTYYLNVLDGACPSLTAGETRLIPQAKNTGSAKLARLCDTDSFTVERQTSRIGCSLGQFVPITTAEASALTGRTLEPPATSGRSSSNAGAARDDEPRESRRRRERD